MLYLYLDGLGNYTVVNDNGQGTQTVLLSTTVLATAQALFNQTTLQQQQVTIMSWDGTTITNYTTPVPTLTTAALPPITSATQVASSLTPTIGS